MNTSPQNINSATIKNTAYNYEHFSAADYDLVTFAGPKVGENAIDFTVTDLAGQPVTLSDFFGKIIVLETGSLTCPQSVSNIDPMNSLADNHQAYGSLPEKSSLFGTRLHFFGQ